MNLKIFLGAILLGMITVFLVIASIPRMDYKTSNMIILGSLSVLMVISFLLVNWFCSTMKESRKNLDSLHSGHAGTAEARTHIHRLIASRTAAITFSTPAILVVVFGMLGYGYSQDSPEIYGILVFYIVILSIRVGIAYYSEP